MATERKRATSTSWIAGAAVLLFWVYSGAAQTVLVKPYVQHGDEGPLGKTDSKVIAWVTENKAADFRVEYASTEGACRRATIRQTLIQAASGKEIKVGKPSAPEAGQELIRDIAATQEAPSDASDDPPKVIAANPPLALLAYRADLKDLPLNTRVAYRVVKGEKLVVAADFLTRKPPEMTIHFLVFGDNARGNPEQRRLAYQMSLAKPEFILNVGDNVYTEGRISQYARNFWPDYCNTDQASPAKGAPLLRTAPYYVALGNHDIDGADLKKTPDGLAAFLFFHWPLNGPANLKSKPPLAGQKERLAWFTAAAGERFPGMCNYSFDNGPAHFLVLDGNRYVDVNEKPLRAWIAADLAATQLPWKFVLFHQPPFTSGKKHVDEQRMRAFIPLFEAAGVQVVFSGHVHNYQRMKPIRFVPDVEPDRKIKPQASGRIGGKISIDADFDGKMRTIPDGIVYVVTGAGGGGLHKEGLTGSPEKWPPFVAACVDDRCSFTRVELIPEKCVIRQIDEKGTELDVCAITRKPPAPGARDAGK